MVQFININSLSESLTLIQHGNKNVPHQKPRKRFQTDSILKQNKTKTGILKIMAHIYTDFVTFKSAMVSMAPLYMMFEF